MCPDLEVKWLGLEADHSPSSNVEGKNAWSYTSTLPVCLHGMVLYKKKHRDSFIIYIYVYMQTNFE
jgi:hypothetical protein